MPRLLKYFKCAFHIISIALMSYLISQKNFNSVNQKKISRFLPDIKHLLIWSTLPGLQDFGQKHLIAKKCYAYNCYLTTNRLLFSDIRYFDGIIFNLQEVSDGTQELPKVRNTYQKYIFAANDSADNYPVCNPVYDNFFNWTWTYKTDSTIPYRFITVYNTDRQELSNTIKWENMLPLNPNKITQDFSTKHIAAAIILDKCETKSKREVFIQNLQRHLVQYNLTIDIYGKCGTKKCSIGEKKPCFWKLKKYYFFYLAFEDSLSEEYITKTVLYAYENNLVPIVYGNASYEKYLPPESYLDGRALGEAKLALTMYQVIYHPGRYIQFFKWKTYYEIKDSEVLDVCSLCASLNNPNWLIHQVTINNFRQWWNKNYKQYCQEPSTSYLSAYFKRR